MRHINVCFYKTKIGEMVLGSFDSKICILDFRYRRMRKTVDNRLKKLLACDFVEKEDLILSQAKKQLDEYLAGERKKFDLPILLAGSDFQKEVWEALLKINYGDTISYLDLAKSMGKKEAVRAVANANGANSIALIVPCHRVIENGGGLGGYGGGIAVKKRLLKLENTNK